MVLIIIGDIESIIDAFSALEWATFGMAFFGLIIMRITEPDRPRPYKVLIVYFQLAVMILQAVGRVRSFV